MSESRKAEIRSQTRLFDDFFKIDEVIASHERSDGTMSPDQRRLVFERGDAVGVLLYDSDRNDVIVVNQFRVPSLIARRRDDPATMDGWVTETVAGMIDEGETPEQTVVRETLEEVGYKITAPELIAKFFSSSGGTSERIFLYFAEVNDAARMGEGGGLEGEDVAVLRISIDALFDWLDKKTIEDPKLIIAACWLRDRLRRTQSGSLR